MAGNAGQRVANLTLICFHSSPFRTVMQRQAFALNGPQIREQMPECASKFFSYLNPFHVMARYTAKSVSNLMEQSLSEVTAMTPDDPNNFIFQITISQRSRASAVHRFVM